MGEFSDKVVVVTGGSRGIGRAIAAVLAGAGAAVTIVGRNEASLEEAVARGDARGFVKADVTDPRALLDGMARAVAARGPVDILVANAGGAESAPFAKADVDLFRRMFELNVMGMVHAARAVIGTIGVSVMRALRTDPITSGCCDWNTAASRVVRPSTSHS